MKLPADSGAKKAFDPTTLAFGCYKLSENLYELTFKKNQTFAMQVSGNHEGYIYGKLNI
jgi:hypothetical protein